MTPCLSRRALDRRARRFFWRRAGGQGMGHTISDIAAATGLQAEGDLSISVDRPVEPGPAGPRDLMLAMAKKYADAVRQSDVAAAVLWPGADWRALGLKAALFAPRARAGLADIGEVFAHPIDLEPGIHPTAIVDETAILGEDCWVGPFTDRKSVV